MITPVIERVEVSKAYGKRITALKNLSLAVAGGTSFGLLGENGAGKSTLVRLIMGFIFPTSGRGRVLGEERVARAHSRIFSPPPCIGIGGCIAGATPANITIGAIGLLANCIVISTLVVAFSAPIATRLARIVLLAWVAAVLYSGTSPSPIATILSITRIPLMPLAACYNLGASGTIGWSGALVIDIAYIIGLTLLAEYWMAKRDLILH